VWRHAPLRALRAFTRLHRWVYLHSRGWLGHHMTGRLTSLVLHTTGRKSGQTRSTVLIYGRAGEAFVVVGSNFGEVRPPGWLLNLEADPRAEVQVGRRRIPVTAEIHLPGSAGFEELLPLADRATGGIFPHYRASAARPIPVVRLVRAT
jgi:deazaflavin-dependent oxidoreductase (nitroreductase family)